MLAARGVCRVGVTAGWAGATAGLSTASRSAPDHCSVDPAGNGPAIVELREYSLVPAQATEYIRLTSEAAAIRHAHVPTRLCSLPETGGPLHRFTHFYGYIGGHDARNAARSSLAADPAWGEYLAKVRPCAAEQSSLIFVEAPIVAEFGLHGMGNAGNPASASTDPVSSDAIYELRRYQLKLGYHTVPRFLECYAAGLPSKLDAPGTDASTSLVSLLYTDLGPLNEVIELWRHGGGTQAMEASRTGARNAPQWRAAIAEIASLAVSFRSTIHKPVGGGLSKWT